MSATLNQLIPPMVPWAERLLKVAHQLGYGVSVTSVRRSRGLQAKLWRDYQLGRSRYPAAPPGHSKHELGLAFDIVGAPQHLAHLGRIWEAWGGIWGGHFNDPIHFEAR